MNYIHEIQYLIRNNRFEHYYLFENVLRAFKYDLDINAKWKIGSNEVWILGFCANNNYNIYGLNFSIELMEEVVKTFDFSELPDKICFSGNKEIIEYLFKRKADVDYRVYKNRFIYEITQSEFTPKQIDKSINIRSANLNDTEILARYNCKFFEEEYSGQNNKDFELMKIAITEQINEGQYIVAEKGNKVLGFCSHFSTKFENDMIGTVYVEEEFRNDSIGKILLNEMTKIVLLKNNKCYLTTDMKSIASNKIVTELGYRKIYEYTSGEMIKL